jgi:hypothetical protein
VDVVNADIVYADEDTTGYIGFKPEKVDDIEDKVVHSVAVDVDDIYYQENEVVEIFSSGCQASVLTRARAS